MKAKDYFNRARNAERDLKRLEALRDHYVDLGSRITANWGATPPGSSSNRSRTETAALGIVEAEEAFLGELEAYRKIVYEAERVISRIQQSKFRQILTLHYLVGLTLAETGERLKYEGKNSIYKAHGWALMKAQEVLDTMKAVSNNERTTEGGVNDGRHVE